MYRVVICEDEKIFAETLEKTCREIFARQHIDFHLTLCTNGEDFLAAFASESYHLILLDIDLGDINGIELAKKIRESDREAAIIFTTSHREYVFEGYDVNALHYLIKPVDATILERLIKAAWHDTFQNSFFVFKSGAQNQRIAMRDIISLETQGRKVAIALVDKTLYYSGKLTEMLDELPKDRFIRCHQSYAVNIGNIRELTRFDAIARNGAIIPISRLYLKTVQKAFLAAMQDV
ncbi:MAG: LytTR family DNA-binding domain-containing protein [Deltaproteobacteria bacterium]|jgi:DNA-binding LytR/AlgR family response regulator|nr:LytTR family DNA-binding domain-containing protein [Deltaproteobacteria bacterium]